MEMNGFDVEQPDDVCDHDGLDENDARAHFNGKYRSQIDYTNTLLTEDLMWMNHQAFKYYLPGYLSASLDDDDGEIASRVLSALASHVSGPKEDRIRFTEAELKTINRWLDAVLNQFGENDVWGFKQRIAKYRAKLEMI